MFLGKRRRFWRKNVRFWKQTVRGGGTPFSVNFFPLTFRKNLVRGGPGGGGGTPPTGFLKPSLTGLIKQKFQKRVYAKWLYFENMYVVTLSGYKYCITAFVVIGR